MTRMNVVVGVFAFGSLLVLASKTGAQSNDFAGRGFAPVNGTRLFYEVKGTGPAVVLIHGGQLDSRMWDEQLDVLAQQFAVIRYDVRGYGGSFQPDQLYSDAVTESWLKDPYMAPAMERGKLAPLLRRLSRENAHCWLNNPILQRSPRPLVAERLSEIKVPTLLVLGDRDVSQINATIETLEKGIKGSVKVVIKGAGHLVSMEEPEEFNETLLAFLEKLK